MPTLNVAAAAQAYINNHRAARAADRHPIVDATSTRVQALAALTAAEEVWTALTGLTGQDAMDYAERVLAGDASTQLTTAGGAEGSLLVTLWADGTGEVAHRADGRWGIPTPLVVEP